MTSTILDNTQAVLEQVSGDKPAICLVSHAAYGAIAGGDSGHIGGVERQTSMLARWLADRGYRVSMITWDEGQGDDMVIDGVRIIKTCRRDSGLPGLRFLHPRWTSLNRALRTADADVYYHNCAECVTGQVAWWCRRNGRSFVYSSASNMDCDPALPELRKLRERVLYRYGVRAAQRVIVQTNHQGTMLRDGIGVESEVLPMPCPGPADHAYEQPGAPTPETARVVWVGRVASIKRPWILLDVAARLPDVRFEVAGPIDDQSDLGRDMRARAAKLPNMTLCGSVSRDAMPDVYRNASVLCCTSEVEGFPNTFLEAWSYGVPVVSTYDPDGIIASRGLGAYAADADGLADALRELLADASAWERASRRSRAYYTDNHAVEAVMPRFERILVEAARGGKEAVACR